MNSAYSNLENSYGNNLATLQTSRDKSIDNINKQVNETNLQYAIKQNELLADIENAKLELQKYGNELAYQKYQDALSNYMKFANYDYQKQQDALSQSNWEKQYQQALAEFEYQKQQDALAQSNWLKEYELSKKNLARSSSSSSSSRSSSRSSSSGGTTGKISISSNNDTSISTDKSYQEVLNNMKVIQGPGITKPIKDGYTGKTFASAEELLAYYGYKATK